MENTVNLLRNRMTNEPAFHAVIELVEKNGVWFYGYRVILKTSFKLSPIPDERSATTQRGEPRKEIALLFALYSIAKTTWTGKKDMDENAIGAALSDEADAMLEATVQTVFTKFRSVILATPRLCAEFQYMLPDYRHLCRLEEYDLFDPQPVRAKAAHRKQLSLF